MDPDWTQIVALSSLCALSPRGLLRTKEDVDQKVWCLALLAWLWGPCEPNPLDEKLSFAAKGCALVTTSHLAMPGRSGSDRAPVDDPALAGSFVCGIKSFEKYDRTITGDSVSIFPYSLPIGRNIKS